MFVLVRFAADSEGLLEKVLDLLDRGEAKEAGGECSSRHSAVARVLLAGLGKRGSGREEMERSMEESILHLLPELERRLPYLAVIAAAAPLLGLLGTVTGMISTFDMIALFGTGDARVLSGGISVALITTELGLIVAVPTLLIHNHLSGRVDGIIADMEKDAAALCNHLSDSPEKGPV
ncbi:MAG: MotA/TolQ/ExbB proton channel family protein [Planctomycetes bacterium]|nr:MotA/TolQ/ExbB proton channel family protein [Planctomycetota bacterium]